VPCSLLALSASTRYNEKPLQQRDTLLNYSRVVASGREEAKLDELRRLYAQCASSARVARNSFSLVYPLVPLPFRSRQRVLSLSRDEPNSCSRFDMSLALPARFGRSVPRLPTRPFIHGSFSLCLSFLSPSFLPLLSLHRRVIHVCIHVRSPCVSSPSTDTCLIFLGERFSYALYSGSEQGRSRSDIIE